MVGKGANSSCLLLYCKGLRGVRFEPREIYPTLQKSLIPLLVIRLPEKIDQLERHLKEY